MDLGNRTMLLAIVAGMLLTQAPVGAVQACGDLKLKFKVDDRGCVTQVVHDKDDAPADEVTACPLDSISWKVQASNNAAGDKDKKIKFKTSSPFDWLDSGFKDKNGKIDGQVRADATPAGQETRYEYSVVAKVDGTECELDPVIIVRK